MKLQGGAHTQGKHASHRPRTLDNCSKQSLLWCFESLRAVCRRPWPEAQNTGAATKKNGPKRRSLLTQQGTGSTALRESICSCVEGVHLFSFKIMSCGLYGAWGSQPGPQVRVTLPCCGKEFASRSGACCGQRLSSQETTSRTPDCDVCRENQKACHPFSSVWLPASSHLWLAADGPFGHPGFFRSKSSSCCRTAAKYTWGHSARWTKVPRVQRRLQEWALEA